MVRLECGYSSEIRTFDVSFQFLNGTIGVSPIKKIQFSPNSFQFLNGTIGVWLITLEIPNSKKFQFLNGTIGVQSDLETRVSKSNFNS